MKILFFLLILISSCGRHSTPAENHGDIVKQNKLIISKENHPELAGERDCFLCHQSYSIHQVDRSVDLDLDLLSIQRSVNEGGINSCSQCHGSNPL